MMTPLTPLTPFRPVVLARDPKHLDRSEDTVREVAPRVARVVRAVLGRNHPDVEDVTQQAMMALVQALPSFRGDCEPVFFASRIAARTAIAAARRGRAERARHDDGVDVDGLFADDSGGAAPAANRRTLFLREIMAKIPAEQAEAMALRVVLGWSLGEVAAATGVPLNTVRSRLRLAKLALRAAIAKNPAMTEEFDD